MTQDATSTSTSTNRIYTTPVRKEKQRNFLSFLRSLKIKKDDVTIKTNGDFYIIDIDLSKKSDKEFGKIRKKLNQKQIAFL